MGKYIFTININIEAMDDIEAREMVKHLYGIMPYQGFKKEDIKISLKEIFPDKPPRNLLL